MKVIYEPDLGVLAGRLAGRLPLSASATRSLISRWQRAGVVVARKVFTDRPRLVWLTLPGARLFGEESFRPTAEFTAYHQAEVAHVRLYVTGPVWRHRRYGAVVEWESERQFRQDVGERFGRGGRQVHVPDGVVTFEDGTRAAIEVERSPKSPPRMRTVLDRLTSVYPEVAYVVASSEIRGVIERAHKAIQEAARNAGRSEPGRVAFLTVPQEIDR